MFLGYIHSFRALAIFFIVAGHSIDIFMWSIDSELERFLKIFFSNGTALFVFIAGYLFQHLSVKYQIWKYYGAKFKYVLVPYFLISIPAILIFVTIMQRDSVWEGFYEDPVWLQVFYFYLTGAHLTPFWFIPMIVIFYIFAPLLVKADQSKYFYYAIPPLLLLSCFVDRGMPHQSFVHFFSLYILGMFCSHYKNEINTILKQTLPQLVLVSLLFILVYFEFYYMKGTMTYVNFLQKCIMSLFFLGLLVRFVKTPQSKLINTIADCSFGIFFIHSYIISGSRIVFESVNGSLIAGGVVGYTVATIATMSICLIIVLLVKRIFGSNSRYLVGS